MNKFKKIFAAMATGALLLVSSVMPASAAIETWNVTGNHDFTFNLPPDPTDYVHDADLTQTGSSIDGLGGHPANSLHVYEWDVTAGTVSGNNINLTVDYLSGPGITPDTVMTMTGTIGLDGSISGTWTDNYGGGTRNGTWHAPAGTAERVVPLECEGMELTNIINGTNNSDSIIGTNGNDLIFALAGADNVYGGGGNDCIVGGNGSDSLFGGNGNDVLLGGNGTDSLSGGNDNDALYGEDGNDSLNGGNGNDEMWGGANIDSLSGGNGTDMERGGTGNDSLVGGNGSDNLDGEDGFDSANGGNASDTCTAEAETNCEI